MIASATSPGVPFAVVAVLALATSSALTRLARSVDCFAAAGRLRGAERDARAPV